MRVLFGLLLDRRWELNEDAAHTSLSCHARSPTFRTNLCERSAFVKMPAACTYALDRCTGAGLKLLQGCGKVHLVRVESSLSLQQV